MSNEWLLFFIDKAGDEWLAKPNGKLEVVYPRAFIQKRWNVGGDYIHNFDPVTSPVSDDL
jgi:hypothetical protein